MQWKVFTSRYICRLHRTQIPSPSVLPAIPHYARPLSSLGELGNPACYSAFERAIRGSVHFLHKHFPPKHFCSFVIWRAAIVANPKGKSRTLVVAPIFSAYPRLPRRRRGGGSWRSSPGRRAPSSRSHCGIPLLRSAAAAAYLPPAAAAVAVQDVPRSCHPWGRRPGTERDIVHSHIGEMCQGASHLGFLD